MKRPVTRTREEAAAQLIEAWKKEGVERPKDFLIIAQTNAEVDRLNREAQAARKDAGQLGWRHVKVGSGETIHVGDRVLFTENRKDISPLLLKSQFATVTHIDMLTRKVTVEVDGEKPTIGEQVKHHATMLVRTALNSIHAQYHLPITKLTNKVTFSLRDFSDLRLSYAVTTHRSQSMTLDRDVYILAGGSMQSFEMGVVQLSRARNQSHIFMDKETVGAGIEELERQMKRSHEKTSAHAVAPENGLEQSLHLSL